MGMSLGTLSKGQKLIQYQQNNNRVMLFCSFCTILLTLNRSTLCPGFFLISNKKTNNHRDEFGNTIQRAKTYSVSAK